MYSRTSENSIPRPLKALWYCPAMIWLTILLVVISRRRIFFLSSSVITGYLLPFRPLNTPGVYGTSTLSKIILIRSSEVNSSASAS